MKGRCANADDLQKRKHERKLGELTERKTRSNRRCDSHAESFAAVDLGMRTKTKKEKKKGRMERKGKKKVKETKRSERTGVVNRDLLFSLGRVQLRDTRDSRTKSSICIPPLDDHGHDADERHTGPNEKGLDTFAKRREFSGGWVTLSARRTISCEPVTFAASRFIPREHETPPRVMGIPRAI